MKIQEWSKQFEKDIYAYKELKNSMDFSPHFTVCNMKFAMNTNSRRLKSTEVGIKSGLRHTISRMYITLLYLRYHSMLA